MYPQIALMLARPGSTPHFNNSLSWRYERHHVVALRQHAAVPVDPATAVGQE